MVSLRARHKFSAPIEVVIGALGDPDYHSSLDLPDVEAPQIVTCGHDGPRVVIDVRYEFTGRLDPVARRIVGRERVAWIQSLSLDPITRRGELRITPELRGVRITCGAALAFVAAEDGGCTRTLDGELKVHVPIVGGRAEASIAPGILRRIDVEAEALERWVAR